MSGMAEAPLPAVVQGGTAGTKQDREVAGVIPVPAKSGPGTPPDGGRDPHETTPLNQLLVGLIIHKCFCQAFFCFTKLE